MEEDLREISKIANIMAMEFSHGLMVSVTRDNGRITKEMGRVYNSGLMELF